MNSSDEHPTPSSDAFGEEGEQFLQSSTPKGEPPLWDGDRGSLSFDSRRALVQLLQGPLIRAHKEPALWKALLANAGPIQARLHEVFLDLIIDESEGFAFTRMAKDTDLPVPKVLRTEKLSHVDTAILLDLRQQVGMALPGERVVVDIDELRESVSYVRNVDNRDEAGFHKRFNAAIGRISGTYNLLTATETPGRYEVSPALRRLFDAETVTAIRDEYRAFTEDPEATDAETDTEHDDTEANAETEDNDA